MEINPREYFSTNYEFADEDKIRLKVHAMILASELSGREIDTLHAAWRAGMLQSGETPSKEGRARLHGKGILCQTCSSGDNYTFSVTYPLGYYVVMAAGLD